MTDTILKVNETRERIYTASAAQTDFAVPFHYDSADEMGVTVTTAGGAVSSPSFTMVPSGDYGTENAPGILRLDVALAGGERVEVYGRTPLGRKTSLTENQGNPSSKLNREYSNIEKQVQEIAQKLTRALLARRGETLPALPAKATLIGKIPYLNPAGTGWDTLDAGAFPGIAEDLALGEDSVLRQVSQIIGPIEQLADIDTELAMLAMVAPSLAAELASLLTVATAIDNGTIDALLVGQIVKRDTHAQLTAIAAANRADKQVVYVGGRLTQQDGGEGFFEFRAASVSAADGGHVLAPDAGTGRWHKIRKKLVDPAEFGAKGDYPTTNDAVALQAAINASAGGILDLMGREYRCDSGLTGLSNVTVRNGKINWSQGLAALGIGLLFAGTLGAADTSLSAVAYTDRSLTVADNTNYAANDDLIVRSDDVWASVDSSTRGQWVRVKGKTGGTVLNLHGSSYDAYSTNRKLYKPTLVRNVRFENVELIGRGDSYSQYGLRFQYAKDVAMVGCTFRNWAYAGLEFYTSQRIRVRGCDFFDGEDALGASYGTALYHGCEHFHVSDCSGDNLRHLFTAGGTLGVNRFGAVKGCTGSAMTEAFIDGHPPCEFVTFANNVGEHETAFDGDGIVYQGANGIITDNQIISANKNGILIQPCAYHNRNAIVAKGNLVSRVESASGIGILVDIKGPVRSLVLADNSIMSPVDRGIVITTSGFSLSNTTISGNSVDGSVAEALYIIANTTDIITRTAVSGNAFRRANQSGPVIDCFAGTEGYNNKLNFTGNTIEGGTYGIRCDAECERVLIGANTIQGFLTAATLLTGVAISVTADNLTT